MEGLLVGAGVGSSVIGDAVGPFDVGASEGFLVGAGVGDDDGIFVGAGVGDLVGSEVGAGVGACVGFSVGYNELMQRFSMVPSYGVCGGVPNG